MEKGGIKEKERTVRGKGEDSAKERRTKSQDRIAIHGQRRTDIFGDWRLRVLTTFLDRIVEDWGKAQGFRGLGLKSSRLASMERLVSDDF